VRPAVILTADELLLQIDDALCFFVSSVIPTNLLPTDLILEKSHPAFHKAGLRFRSIFRTHKLALLHKSLIVRVLGETDQSLMELINQKLRIALGL
jgi:mRNA interferase MazF